ncbi:MAG TPA: peptidylprolyl isomerase [Lacipirellulaceae bacterium]|nr:peptidylprolyl isomerase [Lacipirellulaceae bacterium]
MGLSCRCSRKTWSVNIALLLVAAWLASTSVAAAATPTNKVRFYMNMGTVEIELYGTQSPFNVTNFLSYVDDGSYNNSIIHRTRDGATVAGSDLFAQGGSYKVDGTSITTRAAVPNEFNAANGLSNVAYTLAAARGSNPNSATSGWFINQTNNAASFDPGPYTVLGKVTLGTSIIDQIPFLNNLPILQGSGLDTMPIYNNGEVIINRAVRIPIISGDYNMSGSVTSTDYTTWRNNIGSTTNAAADGNGDGVVDAADYIIWRKAMAHGSGSGAGDLSPISAPEPTAAFLALFGGILMATRRKRSAVRHATKTRGQPLH